MHVPCEHNVVLVDNAVPELGALVLGAVVDGLGELVAGDNHRLDLVLLNLKNIGGASS